MAISKQSLFPDEQNELARFAGSLSHPARIAIVTYLQQAEEATCGELVEALPLAQATTSQHIRALKAADLLIARNDGQKVWYSLNCDSIKNFCHSFQCMLGTDPASLEKQDVITGHSRDDTFTELPRHLL